MNRNIHRALIVTGTIGNIYPLHTAVKDKLWEAGTDYVRLLSPLTAAMEGRLTSFFLAADGCEESSATIELVQKLRAEIIDLLRSAECSFVDLEYGAKDLSPVVLSFQT